MTYDLEIFREREIRYDLPVIPKCLFLRDWFGC